MIFSGGTPRGRGPLRPTDVRQYASYVLQLLVRSCLDLSRSLRRWLDRAAAWTAGAVTSTAARLVPAVRRFRSLPSRFVPAVTRFRSSASRLASGFGRFSSVFGRFRPVVGWFRSLPSEFSSAVSRVGSLWARWSQARQPGWRVPPRRVWRGWRRPAESREGAVFVGSAARRWRIWTLLNGAAAAGIAVIVLLASVSASN